MPLDADQQQVVEKVFASRRPGEKVLDVCRGTIMSPTMAMEHSGYILVTSERLVLRLRTITGWHTLEFQPGMIASVERGKGLSGGQLKILASGSATKVRRIPRGSVERIAGSIHSLMDRANSRDGAGTSNSGAGGLANELAELSRLRDAGTISESEFAVLRSRVIDSYGSSPAL